MAKDSQNEARRLASAVETLNSDRDRLYSRVTVLEHGLDSVTGVIAKQHPALATPPAAASEAAPAPLVGPAATAPAATAERTPVPASAEPAATPATPLVESKSIMAPPDPAASKLIEPGKPASVIAAEPILEVVASAPATGDAEAEATEMALPRIQLTEFGVDVGGANSVTGLRALWRGLLKSRSSAPLAALRPIIVIKEGTGGLGMQLRLVAGPLRDAAAAARICAVMTENKRSCATAVFDGQRLSMDANEALPAATGSVPPRKRGAAKRAAVEEAPKKPQTTASSTISSLFGRKNGQ